MSNDPSSAPVPAEDPSVMPTAPVPALRLLAVDDALLCVDDACLPPDLRDAVDRTAAPAKVVDR